MSVDFGGVFGGGSRAEATRGWRVGHQGRDRMYYEELHDGVWERVDVDGEMLMGPAHHVIYFASPDAWLRYPPWARQRRDEIIARITSEFREPEYEYHGLMAGARSATTGAPASSNVPASGAKRRAPPRQSEIRALLVAVVLLFALAGAMGWLDLPRLEAELSTAHGVTRAGARPFLALDRSVRSYRRGCAHPRSTWCTRRATVARLTFLRGRLDGDQLTGRHPGITS
jgi:hypothetical protein